MPVRNEAAHIGPLMRSILGQDYPRDLLDVWVVDGMSDDDTPAIIRRMSQEDPRLHLLTNEQRTVPNAMNLGIAASKGALVLRIDGHARVPNDFVRRIATLMMDHPEAGLGGGVVRPWSDTANGQSIAAAWSHPFGAGSAYYRTARKAGEVDTLLFGAYRRTALEQAGPFDTRFTRNQDDELSFRLVKAGWKIWLDPSIQSEYFPRGDLGRLYRQFYEYGYYKPMVIEKMGGAASTRHYIPAAFVAGLLLGWPLLPVWLAVVMLYALMAIASARKAISGFPLARVSTTASAFFIMHFAYGWGFWRSMVDRWTGRRQRVR